MRGPVAADEAMKVPLLCLRRKVKEGAPRNDDHWLVAGTEVAQWVNKLNVMEDKIKMREAYLKKFQTHLGAAKRYSVDFTDPVMWLEQMIAKLPWPVRHGRALADRKVAVNVEA